MEKGTKVQFVCDWVMDKIKQQHYLPNQKIPSIRSLAKKLNISSFTVAQAYDLLVSVGFLTAKAGAGYFVCANMPNTGAY